MSMNSITFAVSLRPDDELRELLERAARGGNQQNLLYDLQDIRDRLVGISNDIDYIVESVDDIGGRLRTIEKIVNEINQNMSKQYTPGADQSTVAEFFEEYTRGKEDLLKLVGEIKENIPSENIEKMMVTAFGRLFGTNNVAELLERAVKFAVTEAARAGDEEEYERVRRIYDVLARMRMRADMKTLKELVDVTFGKERGVLLTALTGELRRIGIGETGRNKSLISIGKASIDNIDFVRPIFEGRVKMVPGVENLEENMARLINDYLKGNLPDEKTIRKMILGTEKPLEKGQVVSGLEYMPDFLLRALYKNTAGIEYAFAYPGLFVRIAEEFRKNISAQNIDRDEIERMLKGAFSGDWGIKKKELADLLYEAFTKNPRTAKLFEETGVVFGETAMRYTGRNVPKETPTVPIGVERVKSVEREVVGIQLPKPENFMDDLEEVAQKFYEFAEKLNLLASKKKLDASKLKKKGED